MAFISRTFLRGLVTLLPIACAGLDFVMELHRSSSALARITVGVPGHAGAALSSPRVATEPEPPSSDDLAQRARKGDAPALDALLARHLPGLHAFVRLRAGPLVRGKESPSDIVQSVCRELLVAGSGFEYRNEAAFRRWLCTAALRKLVERQRFYQRDRRDAAREGPAVDDSGADAALFAAYRSVATPSQHAAAHEFVRLVDDALAELPDHYREVIALTRGLGLSQREAAQEMGKSEIAVQRLLTRALVKLAGLLRARGLGEPG
jgi:RNA polymerase sigma-70 factor (ECF subfamily)